MSRHVLKIALFAITAIFFITTLSIFQNPAFARSFFAADACIKNATTKKAKALQDAKILLTHAKKKAKKNTASLRNASERYKEARKLADQLFAVDKSTCASSAKIQKKPSSNPGSSQAGSFASAVPLPDASEVPGGMPGLCSASDDCTALCTQEVKKCTGYCLLEANLKNPFCEQMSTMAKSFGMSLTTIGDVPSFMLTPMIKQMFGDVKKGPAIFDIASQPLPILATKNFIDLDRIDRISKFRAGYGHNYSLGTGEACRSMKHYFWPVGGDPGKTHSPSWATIGIYAPADGVITRLQESDDEAQFALKMQEHPFSFIFHHIKIEAGIAEGTPVVAGQKIGNIATDNNHGEIGVEVFTSSGRSLVSFFDVAAPSVLAEYKTRGVTSLDSVMIAKKERDAHPLNCDPTTVEGRFIGGTLDGLRDSAGLHNWFELL